MLKFLRNILGKKYLLKGLFLILLFTISKLTEGQISLTNALPSNTEDFNSMGATTTLPNNWRFSTGASPTWGAGTGTVTQPSACGGMPNTGGTYNFGVSAACTDRAAGVITSGGFASPNSLMAAYINGGSTNINELTISYDAERYRVNTAAASVQFYYSLNGSVWVAVTAGDIAAASFPTGVSAYNFATPLVITVASFTITSLNIAPGSNFYLRWNLNTTGTNSQAIAIDNVVTTAVFASCLTSTTISSFTPATGPAGTLVTITGTDFVGATNVKVGGVAVNSFTVVNSTTITARLAAASITGTISVVDVGGCTVQSVGTFTVLSQNANCTSGALGTDLIISEVFDSRTGSVGYIEIFNPTAASIALSNYNIRTETDGPTILDLPNLTGTLASGAVAIIRIGDPAIPGSSICTVTTIQTNDGASGFNGNDRVILRKNGTTDLDVVDNPSYGGGNPPSGDDRRGFSQLRNAGNVTPRSSYVSTEWTNADPETCGNLTIAPASVGSANVTITTQPADVNCAAVTFSVIANATPGTINYVWYYHSPASAGWSLVSSLNGTNGLTVAGSGTSSITITGNTPILKDYQFYCQVGSGGSPECVKYTFAVQYMYNSEAFYRTIASGQWTNPAIWQMSTTETGVYVSACQYPVSVNSDKVNIINSHIVTLDVIDVTIDWVNINTGGALTIGTLSQLTVTNGNSVGADFEVNGTLTDGGTTGNGISFSTATWQLGTNGTIIRTNTSSSSVYRDNYEAGMSTIPATANWIVRGNSTVDVSFTTVGGTFYPNLTFESNSGLWNPATGATSSRFSGNSGFVTIKGNLDIGGTGSGTVTIYNENTNASSLQLLGNLIVRNGNTLTNNGNFSGAGFEIKGNVTANGTLTATGITGTAGLMTLSGISPQGISGSGSINLHNVTINNTSTGLGGGISLNRAVSMGGVLTLTSGLINTTSTNLLTLNATATCPLAGSTVSFVNGPMRKTGTSAFVFPVGKLIASTGHYRTIGISAPLTTTSFDAEFFRANATLLGTVVPPLVRVSQCEYWTLDRPSGSADVFVTLSWSSQSPCNTAYVTNLATLVVAHNDGSSLWTTRGNSATTGDVTAGTITSLSAISTFSPFSLGSINQADNPLPFKLTKFTATPKQQTILINWKVANNNDQQQYILERSKDAIHFETIATIEAKSNSAIAEYSYIDAQPLSGWNYYHLLAKDHQNKTQASSIIKVWMGKGAFITVLPNPASEKIVINLSAPSSIQQIQIVNITGQVLQYLNSVQFFNEVNISHLQAGIYYIRFLGKDGLTTRSFVKQ